MIWSVPCAGGCYATTARLKPLPDQKPAGTGLRSQDHSASGNASV